MRVLITRPRADAESLAARLHAQGHTTFIEPLIDITYLDGPPLDLTGVQALAFTSANGARAAARRASSRTIPVIAVGPTTAAEARAQNFTAVSESTGEGVEGLSHHIQATLSPNAGAVLHITGTVTAGDLKGSLATAGFTVTTARAYEAHAADSLSGSLTTELSAGLIGAATFFSPRTASLFAVLIADKNLEPACRGMTALTLSPAVAKALHPLEFQAVRIARAPTAEALLALLP